VRPLQAFESLRLDVVFAVRTFRTQYGIAATIVLVLAAVIGLNTTLFTVLAGIAWRPWPGITNPGEVVRIYLRDPSGQAAGFSLVDALALERAQSLASVAAMRNEIVRVGAGDAVSARGALMVSGDFFRLLGVTFVLGRGFLDQENQAGSPAAVAVISHAYWQSSFSSNPAVLGALIQINDVPFTIVGVSSSDFGNAEPAYDKSVFLPASAYPLLNPQEPAYQSLLHDRDQCCAEVIGRLAPDVTRERAQAELDVLSRGFASFSGNPATGVAVTGTAFVSQPGRADSAQAWTTAALLMVALLLVWLIACANVGNLLLSRAAGRVGEIGTRLALGGSRARIVRQLLIEGFILALAAAALGVAVAFQLPFVLFRIVADPGTTGFFPFSVTPDAAVLSYAVLLAAASTIAFGLAPALYVTRADIVEWLKCRDAIPTRGWSLRGVLLAAQTSVSIVLLVSATLLIRGVQRQAGGFDPGFRVDDVTAVRFELPEGVYNRARASEFFDQVEQGVSTLPLQAAAFASYDPFSRFRHGTALQLPGQDQRQAQVVFFTNVSTDYLRALDIPLRSGRYFNAADLERGSVIVNETLARRLWPGENPVGKTFLMRPRGPVNEMVTREIVGVVGDTRVTPSTTPTAMFYQATRPGSDVFGFISRDPRASQAPVLVIRGTADSVQAISRIAARLDSRVRVQAAPLSETRDRMLQSARWGPILAGTLGLFALALTTVGVSGVFAFAVRQRRREIGVRMALGAPPSAVVQLIVARHARALAVGLALGLAGSLAASMILRYRLHGVSPFDPVTYLSVATVLAICGMAAGFVPARRATRINPIETLREL
jgi:putative ABC transport system permease protein